jgi:hypothetical protein
MFRIRYIVMHIRILSLFTYRSLNILYFAKFIFYYCHQFFQDISTGQPGQNSRDRTVNTAVVGQFSPARTIQQGQERHDRAAGTEQPG